MLSRMLVGISGCSWSIGLLFTQTLPVGTTKRSGFQHGTNENPAGLEIPQCFLSSSPDNRISPLTSPIPSSLINGPLNKVANPAFFFLLDVFSVAVLFWVECLLSFLSPDLLHPSVPSFQSDAQEQRAARLWGGCQTDPQPTESCRLRGDVSLLSIYPCMLVHVLGWIVGEAYF